MKNKLLHCFILLVVIVSLVIPLNVYAAAPVVTSASSESSMARQSGQVFINQVASTNPNLPKWKGAFLSTPQLYHDLTGAIDSYMFAISNGNEIVGHVLVGNSSYGYPIFEAGEAAPPAIPSASNVMVSMQKSFGVNISEKDIGNPISLLYLGIDEQYALYSINGEFVGINLVYGDAEKLSTMKLSLPSPVEYKSNQVEANSTLTAEAMSVRPMYTINFLFMGYYSNPPRWWCGPCSGVSIGHYYKWYSATGRSYPNLYVDDTMYDRLYVLMYAQPWVLPILYGGGWCMMAAECGYGNFVSHWYTQVGSSHYFSHIIPDIDKGWPHALCCYPQQAHWRAIKGYDYSNGTHKIICTNSATSESWEYLNWDSLPSSFHDTVCLHDDGS